MCVEVDAIAMIRSVAIWKSQRCIGPGSEEGGDEVMVLPLQDGCVEKDNVRDIAAT